MAFNYSDENMLLQLRRSTVKCPQRLKAMLARLNDQAKVVMLSMAYGKTYPETLVRLMMLERWLRDMAVVKPPTYPPEEWAAAKVAYGKALHPIRVANDEQLRHDTIAYLRSKKHPEIKARFVEAARVEDDHDFFQNEVPRIRAVTCVLDGIGKHILELLQDMVSEGRLTRHEGRLVTPAEGGQGDLYHVTYTLSYSELIKAELKL